LCHSLRLSTKSQLAAVHCLRFSFGQLTLQIEPYYPSITNKRQDSLYRFKRNT
jgi:hypothetical protein